VLGRARIDRIRARIVRISRVSVASFLVAGAALLLHGGASAAPAQPAIWFAPLPPMKTNGSRPFVGSTDFMRLFTKKAAWPNAARHVSVFKFYGEWVADRATTVELRQAIKDLKRRKISIAVETGPLEPSSECGQGVEGFAGAEGLDTANRIKSAGGTLAYLAFDEPFYYASLYSGKNGCHWDPRQVAQGVSAYIRKIRTVFPNVKFGDIEPLLTGAQVELYKEWLDTYREVTGENLTFIHIDMSYTLPTWPQFARELESFARSRGVAFGLIYFGNYDAASDAAWLAQTQHRFELYETQGGGRPDHAVLQSWYDKPDRVLPETKRTFTNLIVRYARARTRLKLETHAGVVDGRLVASGPLPHARVQLSVEPKLDGSAYPSGEALATASATTDTGGRFRSVLAAPQGTAIVAQYHGSRRYWPAYAVAARR
jgi:hypothetical protein